MAPTSVFRVLSAAHGVFAAALAPHGVPVFLGPPQTDDPLPSCVILGWDGASDDGLAGQVGQQYAEVGRGARSDDGFIVGCAWVQSPDVGFPELLARLQHVLGVCLSALRADPRMGLDEVFWCEFERAEVFLGDMDQFVARLAFKLRFSSIV